MSTSPLFTQKHYEHIIAELRQESAIQERLITAEFLCRVFQNENPKFKPAMFMALVMAEEDQHETPKT
jgi:hypothetical protein